MSFFTRQAHLTPQEWAFYGITIGIVVDTNDPQQMGRVRAQCIGLNDPRNSLITDIPWAQYATPFGGTVQAGTRGEDDTQVTGPTAYGMWAIPKVNSQVLIMCLDGNPQTRVWVGCLHTNLATHTLPHGRFSYQDNENLPSDSEKPVGPFTTFEDNIEPLHTNLRKAFDADHDGSENFEFQTRAADFQAAGLGLGQAEVTLSEVEDDQDTASEIDIEGINSDGTPFKGSRQGYQTSQIAPDQFTKLTPRNLDNHVTALVSPGFHALSMDDRQENCRVRIRTTGGHQIIFDDTNERIYLATARGENWIEMDEQGNIDIYTSGKISAHAEQDINFTSDRSFRVYAKAGIHLKSDAGIQIDAKKDIEVDTTEAVRIRAGSNMYFQTSKTLHVKSGEDISLDATRGTVNVKGDTLKLESIGVAHIKSGGDVNILAAGGNANIQGSQVQLNGGTSAEAAGPAADAEPDIAFYTNRVPNHEPWARSDTLDDTTIDTQLDDYRSTKVGIRGRVTKEDGTGSEELEEITRGKNWRR